MDKKRLTITKEQIDYIHLLIAQVSDRAHARGDFGSCRELAVVAELVDTMTFTLEKAEHNFRISQKTREYLKKIHDPA